jgi:hypothetical protein
MIDRVVADIPNSDRGFTLVFSGTPFPDHQYRLDWVRADEVGGNWYRSRAAKSVALVAYILGLG